MNEQFQHVMVLVSIIIGLAITHLLSGVVDGVDRADDDDEPEIFSLIGLLWAGTAFLWMVNFWWFQYRLLAMEGPWTVWRYLFMVLYSVVLYVLAVVLVPRDWDKVKRYDEFFMRNRAGSSSRCCWPAWPTCSIPGSRVACATCWTWGRSTTSSCW